MVNTLTIEGGVKGHRTRGAGPVASHAYRIYSGPRGPRSLSRRSGARRLSKDAHIVGHVESNGGNGELAYQRLYDGANNDVKGNY
jgi:hypothetical protein